MKNKRCFVCVLVLFLLPLVAYDLCAQDETPSPDETTAPKPIQYISFVSDWEQDTNYAVYVKALDSDEIVRVTDYYDALNYIPIFQGGFSWMPDGDHLVYADGEIFTRNIHTGIVTQLTDQGENIRSFVPVWSPDGQYIAYAALNREAPDSGADIWIVDANGENLRQVTNLGNVQCNEDPSWSPDSQYIAFANYEGGEQSYDIYVASRDGEELYPIVQNIGLDFAPSWSPDGRQIVFAAEQNDGEFHLYMLDVPDGWKTFSEDVSIQRLIEHPGTAPTWSPDGTQILFNWSGIIYLVNADGSDLRVVFEKNAFIPRWKPQSETEQH